MMKILTNPTDSKLKIQYLGSEFSVDAKGSIEVEEEVAIFWKTLHGFLDVSDVAIKAKKVDAEGIKIVEKKVVKKVTK